MSELIDILTANTTNICLSTAVAIFLIIVSLCKLGTILVVKILITSILGYILYVILNQIIHLYKASISAKYKELKLRLTMNMIISDILMVFFGMLLLYVIQ